MKPKMVHVTAAARESGKSSGLLRHYCRLGRIKGAVKRQEAQGLVWYLPARFKITKVRRGPKPKADK